MFDYNYIARLPKPVKFFLVAFLVALSVGYFTGINFVRVTESSTPKGNEDVPEATTMKFKKGKREMLTIIHTHILSISFIFFLLGILVWGTDQSIWLKSFLTIEPFISVLTTFGGIYMLWLGYSFFSYVVIFSGILMTLSYILGVLVVMKDLLK
ncbi:hypothetical protein N9V52_05900 [Flavobacteriaceae bacterium]|nr:hypothetical protein [Flavobacteriaceae bacterium]